MCSMAVGSLLMMRLLVWSMARLGCHPACVSGLGILRFGVSQTASDLGGGLILGGGPHALYGRICPCKCVCFYAWNGLSGPWRVSDAIQHVCQAMEFRDLA